MSNDTNDLFKKIITNNQLNLSDEDNKGQSIIYEFIWRNIDKTLHSNFGAHLAAKIGDVKALWDLILDRFESKTTANLYIVEEEFNNLKWDPLKQTVDDYEATIVNLCNQYKNLGQVEPSDSRKILALVKGLPDSYETAANNLLTSKLNFGEAITLLRTLEKTKAIKIQKDKMIEQQHEVLQTHLFNGNNNNNNRYNNKYNKYKNPTDSSNNIQNEKWCEFCEMKNHSTKECGIIKKLKQNKQRVGNSNSNKNNDRNNSTDNQNENKCYNCGGIGHFANNCASKKLNHNKSFQGKTLHTQEDEESDEKQYNQSDSESDASDCHMVKLVRVNNKRTQPYEFRFDTGANTHCTYNKELLSNIVELKKPLNIVTQSKEPMLVNIIGEIRLQFGNDELVLKDVRYHPEFTENLFSWSAFIKHNDLDVRNLSTDYNDDGHWCYQRKDNKKLFLKMKLRHGLYSIIYGSMNSLLEDKVYISTENLRSANKHKGNTDSTIKLKPSINHNSKDGSDTISNNQHELVITNELNEHQNNNTAAIHQLFGHISNRHINKIIKHDALKHLDMGKLSKLHLDENSTITCSACMIGKGKRNAFKKFSEHDQVKNSSERLFNDVSGPVECVDKDECYGMIRGKYLSLIVDEYSRYCNGKIIMTKDGAYKHIQEFIPEAERQTGNKVKYFHSDGGGEYHSNELETFLKERGIKYETTCAYTPQHNGVVERANRTIWETALTLIAAAKLNKKKFLGEALNYSIYLWNCTIRNNDNKSRNELWNGTKLSFNKLHPFGCDVYVTVPKDIRKKSDDKVYKCIYLGVDDKYISGYRCLDIDNKKLIISRDVTFNNYSFTFGRSDEGGDLNIENRAIEELELNSLIKFNTVMLEDKLSTGRHSSSDSESSKSNLKNIKTVISKKNNNTIHVKDDNKIKTTRTSDRKKQQVQKYGYTNISDYYYEDIKNAKGNLNYCNYIFKSMEMLSNHELSNEPLSYHEAITSLEREEWIKANQSELESLEKNGTWKLVNLPKDKHTIQCKWIYKKKPDLQGNIARYKARLVAKGFTQVYGVDYKETYAPVGKIKSLLMLLSIANQLNYELNHLDVETAFLNANVKEDIFMDLPEGYMINKSKEKELKHLDHNGKIVLKLIKSIYGIKQAPHNWNEMINDTLTEKLNFYRLKSDSCIYVKRSATGHLIFIFIWVDDMLGIYSTDDKTEWNELKLKLMNYYKMKDMGDLQMILGMRIIRDRDNQLIKIDQHLYIKKILKKFNMEQCNPVSTPESNHDLSDIQLNKSNIVDDNINMKHIPYREAIGALLYASICTRPDIAHAVNQVSQFQINPTIIHWTAVKRIIKYLKTYPDLGLEFKGIKNNDMNNLQFHCYCDADWAQDKLDRKSIGGYLIRLNNDVISWQVKKQSVVALSSTEAEYMQMTQAAKEIKWFSNLFKELKEISLSIYYQPTTIMFCDNRSAIELSKNDLYHDRTKHIDLRYHFIRDCIKDNLFTIIHVPTTEQQADIFTKGLQKVLFTKFRNLIMSNNNEKLNDE